LQAIQPLRYTQSLANSSIKQTKACYFTQPANSKEQHKNSLFGSANFKDLGANRTVKIVLIVGISIAATAETFTWCMLGYRKWNAWREGKNGGDVDE
jgi:hypothetical protein